MPLVKIALSVFGLGLAVGCGDDNTADFPTTDCSKVTAGTCVEIDGGDAAALQLAANAIDANTTIVLGSGRFVMTQQLTIRTAGVSLIGQGIDVTTLDFASTTTQGNGVDVIGDGFLIQDLTVIDASKDGIRVESSNGVTFRRIRAAWSNPAQATNGAYGIYPVRSQNVLVEDSRGENAADAGLYVGQCQNVIVRNNTISGNIAGLEIESTQYADVYGNIAENNVSGILVFDFPGNPIIGRDIRVYDNVMRSNNLANFAPGGVSATIPSGTGAFVMAVRRVEVTNNTFENNHTSDIGLISGLSFQPDITSWTLNTADLIGKYDDLALPSPSAGTVANYRTENVVIAGNLHSGSGTMPNHQPSELGALLSAQYQGQPVDSVLYDTVGETSFNATDPAGNTNDNHMCVAGNTGGSFASMALAQQPTPFFRPAAPFAPFDCTTLNGGPITPVVLP